MAALEHQTKVDEEVEELKKDIVRLGVGNADGKYVVPFGQLFDDPKVEQYYEALLGTLKAAKKRGIVDFKGQMLLKGAHDKVEIVLLIAPGDAAPPPPAPPTEEMANASMGSSGRERSGTRTRSPVRGKSPVRARSPVRGKSPIRQAAADDTPEASSVGAVGGPGSPLSPQGLSPRVGADALLPPTGHSEKANDKFEEINSLDADAQCKFFLKSFIFALKDNWKEVPILLKEYKKQSKDTGDGSGPPDSLNHIQAADFLQHHGKTRTASERKAELNDVDINNDGWISFLEYLCLHYKVMILTEFYKRYQVDPVEDLGNDGVGVVNVGHKLVDEVLTLPKGMNPQIEAAIEEFMEQKKLKEKRIAELRAKAEAGGVKGMAAKQELVILESGDETETNRVELTLQAAQRKAAKNRGSVILADLAAKEAADEAKKKAEAKAKMDAKRALFEGK